MKQLEDWESLRGQAIVDVYEWRTQDYVTLILASGDRATYVTYYESGDWASIPTDFKVSDRFHRPTRNEELVRCGFRTQAELELWSSEQPLKEAQAKKERALRQFNNAKAALDRLGIDPNEEIR